jgi:hypothetical protein
MPGSSQTKLFSLTFSILLGLFSQVEAAVVKARSPSLADVGAAVALAADGDTVTVPAGTSTWASTLTITKGITLQGAGIGQTIIQEDMATDAPMLIIDTTLGKSYRLTGIEFRDGSNRTKKFGKGCVVFNGTTKTFRFDHCKFDGIKNTFTSFRNAVCGVVDHNVFISNTAVTHIVIYHDTWDGKTFGDGSWATPIDWGGPNAIYIEDNEFSSDPPNYYGLLDEYGGARFVFRHNRVTNLCVASHGTGSSGRYRGVRHWEIYNNTFTANPATLNNAIHMRGGTGVVFNNTTTGFDKFVTLHTYRYHTAFRMWSGSDGTSEWDLNDPKLYASGTAGPGSGIGPEGAGGTLVVPGAGWSPNQWVGYTIRNLDGLSNTQPQTREGAGGGPGPFFSSIISNTADTIIAKAGSQRPNKIFAAGDRFEIRKVIQSLDMIGASTGDLLSNEQARHQSADRPSQTQRNKRGEAAGGRDRRPNPVWPRAAGQLRGHGKDGTNSPVPRWLNQTIEPVYVWNNTKDGVANAGVAIAPDRPIKEGVHFFNNKPKPGYKPFTYPHPLLSGESRTEDRGQRTEDRGQRTEDGGQRSSDL